MKLTQLQQFLLILRNDKPFVLSGVMRCSVKVLNNLPCLKKSVQESIDDKRIEN